MSARSRGASPARPGPASRSPGGPLDRIARALRAGALALLASAAQAPVAGADEGGGGWFDFLSGLLERPEGAPLEVPLRKRGREAATPPPETAPAAPPPPEAEAGAPAAPPPPAASPPPSPAAAPHGPADVHRHAANALEEVARIADALGVAVGTEPPPVRGPKAPVDVAQQLLRALYKAVALQTRLGMDASRVPALDLDLAHATPSQNYDMVGLLLAELARIKAHLGVDEARAHRPGPPDGDGGLDDAFAVVLLLIAHLDTLSAAVTD